MSFHTYDDIGHALSCHDLNLISRVYKRILAEELISDDAKDRFGRFIFETYDRGLCVEENLYKFCKVAAKHKFANNVVNATVEATRPQR